MKEELATSIIVAVFASSGFWALVTAIVTKVLDKKNAKTKMILGLGHDRIKTVCEEALQRGWITTDDYEDLDKYLYQPYRKMGGNGTAEKLMNDVRKLPIHKNPTYKTNQNGSRRVPAAAKARA